MSAGEIVALLEQVYPSALTPREISERLTTFGSDDSAAGASILRSLEAQQSIVALRTCPTGSVLWAARPRS